MQLITNFVSNLIRNLRDEREEGQTMVEYGLIVALISIAAITVLLLIGPELIAVFEAVVDGLQGAS